MGSDTLKMSFRLTQLYLSSPVVDITNIIRLEFQTIGLGDSHLMDNPAPDDPL